jgi:hypothetical protein
MKPAARGLCECTPASGSMTRDFVRLARAISRAARHTPTYDLTCELFHRKIRAARGILGHMGTGSLQYLIDSLMELPSPARSRDLSYEIAKPEFAIARPCSCVLDGR